MPRVPSVGNPRGAAKAFRKLVINRGLVVAAERHERLVFAFTVNEEGQASRLVTLGVNGIVTDRPDVVVPVVRSL